MKTRRGFTLIEVLISLVLLGSLLVALNMFVFSMAELWGGSRDKRLFEEHARAVTRHVRELLAGTIQGAGGQGMAAGEVRLPEGGEAVRLTFTLPEGGRLLTWPGAPLPDVECSLGVSDRRGLTLLWQSRLDLRFGEDPPSETVISPFVVSMAYDYYDEGFERWEVVEEIERDLESDSYTLPVRVRLRFQRGEQNVETVVMLPVKGEGATWY